MAYFRCVGGVGGGAVLTLTYSSEFYGETITATDGTKTVTKVAPSTGTMDIPLPESGTWVVSATIDGQTYSTTVTVDLEYTATFEAIPNGSTVLPTDDIEIWLACAQIKDKAYTTLGEVLSDTDTLIALCADSNACDYMARSTTWASGVTADSTAMLIVGKYNYCANKLISNATWCETLAASSYWEYVFDVSVPKMTGATTPSGSATASSTNGSNYPWKAFDRDTSDWWQSTSSTSAWLQYVFVSPVCIKCVGVYTSQAASQTFDLWLSNDESTWTKYEDIFETITTEKLYTASIDNDNSYKYARLVINCPTATYLTVRDCQFYGRTDNANYIPLVPKMTSNTTPSGTCSGTSIGTSTTDFYKAFDGDDITNWFSASGYTANQRLVYTFPRPVKINRFRTKNSCTNSSYSTNLWKNFKIQGSNDGFVNDIHDLYTGIQPQTLQYVQDEVFSNEDSYTSYGILCIDNYGGNQIGYLGTLQFYSKQAHTLIHSAVEDNIFYMDDGSPVALCGIPVGDTIDVDMESFKGQTLTLVSTVAKDPTNLSNDFSMNVRITPNITEIYLMPVKELYWYGHEGKLVEDTSPANGWSHGSWTFIAPNRRTNYIDLHASTSISDTKVTGIGTKWANNLATNVHCVYTGITLAYDDYGILSICSTKDIDGTRLSYESLTSNTMTKITKQIATGNYAGLDIGRSRQAYVHALWLE